MRKRKSQTVEKEIKVWETKLAGLREDLDKAEKNQATAKERRKGIVLLAKTGNEKAQRELERLTDSWLLTGREVADLKLASSECDRKLTALGDELGQARQRELREQYERAFQEILELSPGIDRAVEGLVKEYEKTLALAKPMGEVLDELDDTQGVKLRQPYLSLRRTLSAHLAMHLRVLKFDHLEGTGLENISTFLREGRVKPLAQILSPEEPAEEHEKPRREVA
ncbi:hypothetical protein MYX78_03680 [Acidobacteria bacterium AH-259-G07]|nr:hypothetical protein [Acidobacteria bacterium AH-259-G07]